MISLAVHRGFFVCTYCFLFFPPITLHSERERERETASAGDVIHSGGYVSLLHCRGLLRAEKPVRRGSLLCLCLCLCLAFSSVFFALPSCALIPLRYVIPRLATLDVLAVVR